MKVFECVVLVENLELRNYMQVIFEHDVLWILCVQAF